MHTLTNHLRLNCALIRYLKEASEGSGGVKAAFAAAMLVDLGYFDAKDPHPSAETLQTLLALLEKGGYATTRSEILHHCKACVLAGDCSVGQIVLTPSVRD